MISDFSYTEDTLTLTLSEAGIESFMAALPNFTYHGTGSMEGKTYDKIWDFTGFSDVSGLSMQIEWFYPNASGQTGYGVRILKNGEEEASSGTTAVSGGSSAPYKHIVIKDGSKVVMESLRASYSNSVNTSICLYRAAPVASNEAAYYGSVRVNTTGVIFNGGNAKAGGAMVTQGAFFAQPLTFGATNGSTPSHYIYDGSTAYAIQSVDSNGNVYNLGSNNGGIPVNGTIVQLDGHNFVRFGPFASSANVGSFGDAYAIFFRVS